METFHLHSILAYFHFRPGDSIRLEKIPDQLFDQTASLKLLTDFFSERKREVNGEICKVNIGKDVHSQDRQSACAPVEVLLNLPKSVQSCLAALVQYLQDFKLEKILRLTRYRLSMESYGPFRVVTGRLLI